MALKNSDVNRIRRMERAARQTDFPKEIQDQGKTISKLLEMVGDETSGMANDINTLKTVVGDFDSGLVKAVADIDFEPRITRSFLVADKKTIQIDFNVVVFPLFGTIVTPDIKSNVQISTDGETFENIGETDTVSFTGGITMLVTFASALSTATNIVKIKPNAILSALGIYNSEWLQTDVFDASI